MIFKDIWSIIPETLLDIFNKSISQGISPDCWKIGTIIPIPKVSNPQQVSDLRPIALLPLPGKILERLTHNKLYPYLEDHHVLSNCQNGFRKQHGTMDTIFKFISHITDSYNRKENTLAIFIDFKKAFDTLNFDILLGKLSKLNLLNNLDIWFKNYLTNRKQLTHMNNVTSNVSAITHGVPQGSILGPLLFNLYINDLHTVVLNKLLLYANDSVIYASSASLPQLFQNLQSDFSNVDLWCRYHKLTMNIKKTKVMCFSSHPVKDYDNNCIQIGNETIEIVPVYKYLGIQLDCKLTFNCQYNETYKLASYKLSLLRRVRSYITEFTALTIVKSMLLPYLDMGNLYFSTITMRDMDKLDIVLNSALRFVYNIRIPREIHNVDLYDRANLFSLAFGRKYFMLNMIHRLIYTDEIALYQPLRQTRRTQAPLVKTYIASNQTIAKSGVYVARDLWNSLSPDTRLIISHDTFENLIKKNLGLEYTVYEMSKLTAGLFV